MAVRKRRIGAADAVALATDGNGPRGGDHDVEVVEHEVVGPQFTVDAVVARLQSEGVDIVRTSPFLANAEMGTLTRLGQHKLVFRATDAEAVAEALRDADLF